MGFQVASRFRVAAEAINSIPTDKYLLFLTRIIQKLHIKNGEIFNETEKDQLKQLFVFSSQQLDLVYQASCYIFEEAAFTSTGPEPLFEILLEAGFDESHGKAVGRLWATEAPGYISKLKEKSLGYPTLLSSDYRLNLRMSDSIDAKQQDPTALFEFTIGSPETTSSASSVSLQTRKEVVTVEFSHPELALFFSQLDKIQQQLDSLNPS